MGGGAWASYDSSQPAQLSYAACQTPFGRLVLPVQQISYRCEFSAAHRLYREDWSDARNQEVFGVCANPNGHGHNYLFIVTLQGEVEPETGMVFNFLELKEIVAERIFAFVDHRNLNLDVPFLEGVIPTAENMLTAFWEQLAPQFVSSTARLHRLRLHETRDCYSDYYGPDHD